jgi:2-hydroxychromene-2-carboxylate isomerase
MNKKNKIKNIIGAIFIIGIVFFWFYMRSPRGMILMTEEIVPVYATEKDALTSPSPAAIEKLAAGKNVPVIRCVDVKSYYLHEVRLPDGKTGFINEGKYILMRNNEIAFCG